MLLLTYLYFHISKYMEFIQMARKNENGWLMNPQMAWWQWFKSSFHNNSLHLFWEGGSCNMSPCHSPALNSTERIANSVLRTCALLLGKGLNLHFSLSVKSIFLFYFRRKIFSCLWVSPQNPFGKWLDQDDPFLVNKAESIAGIFGVWFTSKFQ